MIIIIYYYVFFSQYSKGHNIIIIEPLITKPKSDLKIYCTFVNQILNIPTIYCLNFKTIRL